MSLALRTIAYGGVMTARAERQQPEHTGTSPAMGGDRKVEATAAQLRSDPVLSAYIETG